jgi:hypothetical protein
VQSSTDLCAFYTTMIKTLRITSVVAAILAGVFFVFPVVYGVRSDERIDEFLKQPSVKEKFEDVSDNKAKAGESRVSPLVEQAEAFALYLNPLKPTVKKTSTGSKTTSIASKVSVTPKFKVFGTIYCPGNPELSQVLIDEPGRERRWIRQSDKVGHLFIEQVKDGVVVVKSSDKTFELLLEEKPETNILNRSSPVSTTTGSSSRARSTLPYSARVAGGATRKPIITPQKPGTSEDNEEKMGELVDKLKDLQKNSKSDKTTPALDSEERAARIQELISKFKSTRVSAEEAKKLGNLGEELKDVPKETNQSVPDTNTDEDEGEVEESTPKTDKADEE